MAYPVERHGRSEEEGAEARDRDDAHKTAIYSQSAWWQLGKILPDAGVHSLLSLPLSHSYWLLLGDLTDCS